MGFKRRGAPSDPGYFALLRELRAKRESSADRAARLAAEVRGERDRLRAAGWAHASDPGFVRALYDAAAASDPELELALARLDARDNISWLGLRLEGFEILAPLLAARLATDDPYPALQLFFDAPEQLGRPLPGMRELAAAGGYWSRAAHHALAGSPFEDDRRWALARLDGLDEDDADAVRAAAAIAGEADLDPWLLEALGHPAAEHARETLAALEAGEARHVSRSVPTPRSAIIRAVAARRLAAAVEPLCELLWSFDALDACEALAAIGEPSAIAPLEDLLAALGGDRFETAPYRIFAENALSALGRPQPVELARAILDEPVPRRFGYIEDEVYRVYAAAMAALVDRGTPADRRRVAGYLDIPLELLRDQALGAIDALGEPPPRLTVYDAERVARTRETALIDALGDPGAIGKAAIVAALLERGSPDGRRRAIEAARRRLEAAVNTWIDEPYDAGPDHNDLIAAIENLEGDERALLEGTTSAWIRSLVLGEGDMPYPVEPSSIADGVSVDVERFDRLPFVFGTHINGLAVTADGRRMALLGDHFCKIIDARTGEFVAQLNPGWTWGYDAVFDGRGRLYTCFHGGHVERYDGATGVRQKTYVGHGGVPDGVKRLAVSADGRTLVSVGQDCQVIGFDADSGERLWVEASDAGSCEAVAFAPDGSSVVASHVKTGAGQLDYLSVHQPRTGESRRVEMPSSVWAIAFSPAGDRVALGGAGKRVRVCDADFATVRELELARATRLAFSTDGRSLVGCSAAGRVVRWDLDDPKSDPAGEVLLESGAPLWALVLTPSGQVWTIGTAGVLHRIGAAPIRGETHTNQITGIEVLGGQLVTGSWDGRVLAWPLGGGVGRERLAVRGRVNRLAADDRRIYAATADGLYVIDATSAERLSDREHDEIAVSGDLCARDAGRQLEVVELPSAELRATATVGSDDVSAVCAFAAGFLAGSEEGEVCYVAGDRRLWAVCDHGHDRLEHGNSHKDVCDVLAIAGGFASSGNDNTVRVYSNGEGRPRLVRRLHVGVGIFNKLARSPDGAILAVPSSGELALFRLDAPVQLASLRAHEHFENEELTVARFIDDGELIVGTENGHLFRVRVRR